MNRPSKSSVWVMNLLIATAITLVVNFSYLLLLIVDKKSEPRFGTERFVEMPDVGVLSVCPDGHGYIVYSGTKAGDISFGAESVFSEDEVSSETSSFGTKIDSVYVSMSRIRRLGLQDGDRLVVNLTAPRNAGAHYVMGDVQIRNGAEFDYSAVFNRPSAGLETLHQLFYYLALAFVLLSIITSGRRHSVSRFAVRSVWCVLAASALYLFAPTVDRHSGCIMLNFMSNNYFDFILILKCSFTLVVAVLYGWSYRLSAQRQAMAIENEQLKNENLITRYNMLVSQVNPHFFFNSLNSLAMLVREKHDEKALTYIDQLSYTFRYILRNGQNTLMTLDEELKFADAYIYLFKIRYADKLFFDIAVDEKFRSWILPALTLQPLIDNAVKHNMITRANPLHITIRTDADGCLVVSNPKVPRLEAEPGTGIGLENLRNRWELITGREVGIVDTDTDFSVRLPLQKPPVR